ncbi:MAG: DUF1848 domain-containing protein [Clostridiaceae bacterium]|nr:DUF1848 domain-containing protein [Clostridiaceae bacterium]
MIVSVSRRTDIPALYSDWFFQRLAAGEARVPNPMNPAQVRRVSLRPDDVDGFVFWSKHPAPMLSRLNALGDIPFYFHYSLNPYGTDIEPGIPSLERRIETLLRLSDRVGPDRVTWRYDPILLNPVWTPALHEERFGKMATALAGAVRSCVFSFVDRYRKNSATLVRMGIQGWDEPGMRDMARRLAEASRATGLQLETCAEPLDLSAYGIGHAACVDAARFGLRRAGADRNQRPACGCSPSVDIGMYDTCTLGCVYCYANAGRDAALRAFRSHDPCGEQLSCRIPADGSTPPI